MDACWEADTFCPYLENHHGDQEHKGKTYQQSYDYKLLGFLILKGNYSRFEKLAEESLQGWILEIK